jgi:hypothetical protein
MSFKWRTAPEAVFVPGAQAYIQSLKEGSFVVLEEYAPKVQAFMVREGPWTDQTGEARRSLYAEAVITDMPRLIFGHGAPHGIFLETAHGGRYAIIPKTLDIWAWRIMRDIKARMGGRQ